MNPLFIISLVFCLISYHFQLSVCSPIKSSLNKTLRATLENIPGDVLDTISINLAPDERIKLAAVSKKLNQTVTHIYGKFNLNLVYRNCPKWIIRKATENVWTLIDFENPINPRINKSCLIALNSSIEAIPKLHSLDLSGIDFDLESLTVLGSLLKHKGFNTITVSIPKEKLHVMIYLKKWFPVLGKAKRIDTLIIKTSEYYRFHSQDIEQMFETTRLFAKSSKIQHLKITHNLLTLILPHGHLFNYLESITILNEGYHYNVFYNPPLPIESIESFPKLNALYCSYQTKNVLLTRNSINGASILFKQNPLNTRKKLKSLIIHYEPNQDDQEIQFLLNSKDTLKSLVFNLKMFSETDSLSLNHNFFKNNVVLKDLSINLDSRMAAVDFTGSNLNLTRFSYSMGLDFTDHFHSNNLVEKYDHVFDFILTQKHLNLFKY